MKEKKKKEREQKIEEEKRMNKRGGIKEKEIQHKRGKEQEKKERKTNKLQIPKSAGGDTCCLLCLVPSLTVW